MSCAAINGLWGVCLSVGFFALCGGGLACLTANQYDAGDYWRLRGVVAVILFLLTISAVGGVAFFGQLYDDRECRHFQ